MSSSFKRSSKPVYERKPVPITGMPEALEQIPERIEALFKYAVAFADTVDGNLAMADYMAKYRK